MAEEAGQVVGRVLGTQSATPLSFWVGLEPGTVVQLDEVIAARRDMPGRGEVLIAGVVTNVEARHEGAAYDSDVFLIADGVLPAAVVEAAEVTVTRVEPEVYVPPLPGSVASRAGERERERALYFDVMERRVPVGLGRDGEPIHVNMDFLDGTRGAHVSISGISGVATKTSFATFMLYSIFNSGALGAEAHNTKALIFSVKGEDRPPPHRRHRRHGGRRRASAPRRPRRPRRAGQGRPAPRRAGRQGRPGAGETGRRPRQRRRARRAPARPVRPARRVDGPPRLARPGDRPP